MSGVRWRRCSDGRACRTHASALPRTRALMADCCAFYDSMTTRGHVQHPSYTATCGFTREVAQSWATLTFAIWPIILGGQRNLFLVFGGTEVVNNNRCRLVSSVTSEGQFLQPLDCLISVPTLTFKERKNNLERGHAKSSKSVGRWTNSLCAYYLSATYKDK